MRSSQFATVHCLAFSKDRLLYVCDRVNNRIQVFRPDGTFLKEAIVAAETRGFGAVHSIAFSPDERFVYVGDGANKKVWILERDSLNIVGSFGSGGRAGGQVLIVHTLAVDSKGNVYVGETVDNNRVQRFNFVGLR
jgi:sugar lactone lactonase YvrE